MGLAVFRLRIVRGGRKWVLAMTGNATVQLGIPGSKFYAIQDDHDMAQGFTLELLSKCSFVASYAFIHSSVQSQPFIH